MSGGDSDKRGTKRGKDDDPFERGVKQFSLPDPYSPCFNDDLYGKDLERVLNEFIDYAKAYNTDSCITTAMFFKLIEHLMDRDNIDIQDFLKEIIEIIRLDPNVFYCRSSLLGYNIFMMFLDKDIFDYSNNTDDFYDDLLPFFEELFKILNDHRLKMLETGDLSILEDVWDVENVSATNPDGEETVLSLAIKTRNIWFAGLFFFKGCRRLPLENEDSELLGNGLNDDDLNADDLFKEVIRIFLRDNFFHDIDDDGFEEMHKEINNFGNKLKIHLGLQCLEDKGFYLDTFSFSSDLMEFMLYNDNVLPGNQGEENDEDGEDEDFDDDDE